jgi:hypothetical protein
LQATELIHLRLQSMTLTAPQREPSSWDFKKNGAADKIHGYDDGEAMQENPRDFAGHQQPIAT